MEAFPLTNIAIYAYHVIDVLSYMPLNENPINVFMQKEGFAYSTFKSIGKRNNMWYIIIMS